MRGLRKSERVCDVHKALITIVIATESFIMKKKEQKKEKSGMEIRYSFVAIILCNFLRKIRLYKHVLNNDRYVYHRK